MLRCARQASRCARPCAQERGSAGLEALLAAEKEERMPEFLRKRPKFYYYYEWMRKRIGQQARGRGRGPWLGVGGGNMFQPAQPGATARRDRQTCAHHPPSPWPRMLHA